LSFPGFLRARLRSRSASHITDFSTIKG
jgi:hypothetical protein